MFWIYRCCFVVNICQIGNVIHCELIQYYYTMCALVEKLLQPDDHHDSFMSYRSNMSSHNKAIRMSGFHIQKRKTFIRHDSDKNVVYCSILDKQDDNYVNFFQPSSQEKEKLEPGNQFMERSSPSFYEIKPDSLNNQNKEEKIYEETVQESAMTVPHISRSLITSTEEVFSSMKNTVVVAKVQKPQPLVPKNTRLYTEKYYNKKKLENQLNYRQRISKFFGEGVNSLILQLNKNTINLMILNVILDVIFRITLFWLCLQLFLVSDYTKRYLWPLLAELWSRFLFFVTLCKMSFDEKSQVSRTYQKSITNRCYVDIEVDRLFMRHLSYLNISKMILKSMIPPELINIVLRGGDSWKKTYYMLNNIFKGIQNVFVLLAFSVSLLLFSQDNKQVDPNLHILAISVILEQVIRYILNYLIINTFSK